jgi:thiamine biosynthesis protein ThiS
MRGRVIVVNEERYWRSLRIQVNGEPREVEENISLSELIANLSLKVEQVAVELNQGVVRRARWENTTLQADDKVEVVHFVGGG